MSKKIKQVFFFLVTMTVLFACQKKFDKFYERPDTLEQPIYQQLQAKGKFVQFLKLIDKAGYKHQRGINNTDACTMYSLNNRLLHIVIISRQFLLIIYEKTNGNIDRNTEGNAKNQNCRWFYSYTKPSHNSGCNDQGNDIGN